MYEIRTRATTLTGSRANCYTNTPLRLTSFTLRLLYASYMDSHPSILDLTQVKEQLFLPDYFLTVPAFHERVKSSALLSKYGADYGNSTRAFSLEARRACTTLSQHFSIYIYNLCHAPYSNYHMFLLKHDDWDRVPLDFPV